MEFVLRFNLDNAAFDADDCGGKIPDARSGLEIADILDSVSAKLRNLGAVSSYDRNQSLRDVNGNTIGSWSIEK